MEIVVRKIENEDLKWVSDLKLLFGKEPQFIEPTSEFKHAYFAAYIKDKMVGHSIVLYADKWILDGLFVMLEHRRKGIAKKLIEARIEFIKQNSGAEVFFNCGNSNLASIKSHEKFGFMKSYSGLEDESPEPSCWYVLEL